MSFGIIGTVLTVGSTVYSANKAKSAAQAQANAQIEASDTIYRQFKETERRLAPYSDAGLPAFQKQQALSGALGPAAQEQAYQEYRESPGVAFARERGLQAIDQNAAATGQLISGNRDKRRMEFAQGMALQDFNNYFNRLGTITGTGLAAAQAIGGVGATASQGQAQMQAGAGQSIAAGQLGAAQAYQSGISNVGRALGGYFENRAQKNSASGIGGYWSNGGRW